MKTLLTTLGLTLFLPVMEVNASQYSATYYSNYYNGRRMANGQRFSQNAMVAAHPTMKLGTRLRVRHKNRSVIVTVKDRCRCSLDLSKGAFRRLAPLKKGRIVVSAKKV